MRFKANEDPLVFPEEFKCGMKEELEHTDVTGGDREMTKKIVLAHLKEDPHYYSKLDVTMKADYQVPLNKPKKDPLPDFPRFETDLNVRKKAEESSPKEDMKSTLGFIKHQDADRTRARQNQQKMTPAKAEEESVRTGRPFQVRKDEAIKQWVTSPGTEPTKKKAEEEKKSIDSQKKDKQEAIKKVYDTVLKAYIEKAEEEIDLKNPQYSRPKSPKISGYLNEPHTKDRQNIIVSPKKAEEEAIPTKSETDSYNKYHEKIHNLHNKVMGTKVPFVPMPHLSSEEKAVSEKPRVVPGKAAPKTREYLKDQKLLAEEEAYHPGKMFNQKDPVGDYIVRPKGKLHAIDPSPGKIATRPGKLNAEESSPKEDMKSTLGFIKHQDADRTRARQNQQKMTPAKAEEATCADCGKKLSTSLIEKAEEELGKDKIEEIKNQTIIDKFAEEEKAKPARFQAEPAEAGIMDGIKSTIKNLTSSPKPEPYVKPTPLTKSSIRKQVQRA